MGDLFFVVAYLIVAAAAAPSSGIMPAMKNRPSPSDTREEAATIPVSAFIVRYMERLGITTLFGMPGAHILPVYDQLHESNINSVLVKHEQGAAFMAGGHARASGGIGACITTAGPGATNLVTGIANAYADRQPILIITGETSTNIFGRGGLQESSGEAGAIDQGTLFRGITRYHRLVERVDYLPSVLNQASNALLADSPGPVLLSFPYNVQQEPIDPTLLDTIRYQRPPLPDRQRHPLTEELAARLLAAKQPLILAGYGAIQAAAHDGVTELSETLQIPVATSLKGKGIIDERSPLALGTLGVTSGGSARDYLLHRADLVLLLGAAFNERTSYLWDRSLLVGRTLIQIDIDPGQIGKVFQPDLALVGDIRDLIAGLLWQLREQGSLPTTQPSKPTTAASWQQRQPLTTASHPHHQQQRSDTTTPPLFDGRFALVQQVFEQLNHHSSVETQIFDDNIVFAQNFLHASDTTRYHPNSGISSLGHAIPAAIGARFARRCRTFAILGDGGFQMCCMELMTAVNYQIPITVLLFNNGTLGLIRKNQQQRYQRRYIDCDFSNPDFAQLASALGIAYRHIERGGDIAPAFANLDLDHNINLIEIVIDRDAFPSYQSGR